MSRKGFDTEAYMNSPMHRAMTNRTPFIPTLKMHAKGKQTETHQKEV